MRRKISLLALVFCMVTLTVFAGRYLVSRQYLSDSTNGLWNELPMNTATANYTSDKILIKNSEGYSKLNFYMTDPSNSTMDIGYQLSDDGGTTWYTPYDTDGNDLSAIATSLAANRSIVFNPSIGEYIRFNFTLGSANANVTAEFVTKSSL